LFLLLLLASGDFKACLVSVRVGIFFWGGAGLTMYGIAFHPIDRSAGPSVDPLLLPDLALD
jgi:hypothetical protein